MLHKIKTLAFLILIANMHVAIAQAPRLDNVEEARKLAYSKNYAEAVAMLQRVEASHPSDVNAIRLHAQVLYWMKDFDGAISLYQNFLQSNPNRYVQLDYGRMLYQLSRYKEAKPILEDYIKTDSQNVEALDMLGDIAYSEGHSETARQYFQKVLVQYPKNEWALKSMAELNLAASPYIKLLGAYANDSQPLSSTLGSIEAGKYFSNLLSPKLIAQIQSFDANGTNHQVSSFQLGNKFSFPTAKFDATFSGGFYQNPITSTSNWLGSIELNQKLSPAFSLNASASHQPYFNTISSLKQTVTYDTYIVALMLNKANGWMGWAGFIQQQYMDSNAIQSYAAWLLLPPLKLSDISFHIGYSVNFSNSNRDNFVATTPLAQARATNVVDGIYTPYFTPLNQLENSVLANLLFKPDQNIAISLNSRIGLYTVADKPGFFIGLPGNTIQKRYVSEKYTPIELNAKFSYSISSKTSLDAGYTYLKTFFYNSNVARLGLYFKL